MGRILRLELVGRINNDDIAHENSGYWNDLRVLFGVGNGYITGKSRLGNQRASYCVIGIGMNQPR